MKRRLHKPPWRLPCFFTSLAPLSLVRFIFVIIIFVITVLGQSSTTNGTPDRSTLQATPTVTTSPPQNFTVLNIGVVIPLEDPTITSTLQVLNLTLQDLNFPFFSYSNKTISNPFFHPTLRYALTFRTSNSSIGLATEVAVDLAIRGNATGTNDSGMTVGIVGDIDSERVGPAALASGVFKIVQCTPATDPSFSDKADFTHLFRITPSDEAQGHALASLVSYFGWTKVALISANTFYGFGVSSGFQSRALTLNITTLRNEAYNRGDTEFRLQMASLKTSDARIFVVVGDGEDAILMLREARRLGMTGREYLWIGSDRVEGMHKRLYDPNTLFPYTSEDRENAEGMIFLSRMLRDSPGFIDFTIRFRQMYNKTPPLTSYHLRDCLLAMAAGFKRIVETTSIGEIVGRRTGVDAVGFTRGLAFEGTSGWVEFDENSDRKSVFTITNLIQGRLNPILLTNPLQALLPLSPPTFRQNSTTPPLSSPLLTRDILSPVSTYGTVLTTAIFVCLLLLLVSLIVIIFNRHKIRQMGVVFLVLQGIGLGVGFMGVWTYLGEMEQDGWCRMRSWTQWMGYSIFIQGLLPKLYRIFRVCENRSLIKRITHLEDRNLLILSLPISLPNIILLLTWQFQSPLSPTSVSTTTSPNSYHIECTSPKSALYAPLLIIYNLLLLLLSLLLAFLTRTIPESLHILYGLQSILIALVVTTGVYYGGASNYVATTAVIVALVFVAMVVIMAGTVGRAAWIALKAKERNESLGSGRSMGSRSLRSRGARSRRSEEETGKRDLEKGDKEVQIVKKNMTEDGCYVVTIPVKDTSRLLSLWKKSTISICPKTALITIINTDTQIGLTSFFTPQTLQPPSPSHPNCVLLRMGPLATTSRQNASIHICQFRNASAISEFLALIAGIAEQSGVSSNAPDGKL